MHKLPLLEPARSKLETCVFCPKLCRSACPVSNAEPRETLTPWGKMSSAYFAARGDVPLDESFARPAWACTGCFACRGSCDHQNDVAGTRHRFAGSSQRRQCGLLVLRMLVMGAPPNCGGPGMPQRANINSRTPSDAMCTMGAR